VKKKKKMNSSTAEVIGKRVLEIARMNKLNPMAVCVLNEKAQTLFFQMEDGNPLLRENIARGKALGALGLGVDSANMAKMFTDRPGFMGSIFAMTGGGLVPVPGGVVVRDVKTNAIIGAVGVSGDASEKDEWCAVEGILKAGLTCAAIKEKREAILKNKL
jgi:uncharacterized protein GlcG (DUF336 family)